MRRGLYASSRAATCSWTRPRWIAEASGIPKFIIGATIVSFATTLPEMLVSVFAALEGNADIAVGNAVGSVTANTGLIMCLSLVCMDVYRWSAGSIGGEGAACCWRLLLSLFGFTRDGRLVRRSRVCWFW